MCSTTFILVSLLYASHHTYALPMKYKIIKEKLLYDYDDVPSDAEYNFYNQYSNGYYYYHHGHRYYAAPPIPTPGVIVGGNPSIINPNAPGAIIPFGPERNGMNGGVIPVPPVNPNRNGPIPPINPNVNGPISPNPNFPIGNPNLPNDVPPGLVPGNPILPPKPNNFNSNQNSSSNELPLILGVSAAVLFLILASIAFYYYLKRKKESDDSIHDDEEIFSHSIREQSKVPQIPTLSSFESGELHSYGLDIGESTLAGGAIVAGGIAASSISKTKKQTEQKYFEIDRELALNYVPITNISEASTSKFLDDPFYEVNSDEENLYAEDGSVYVLPPMNRKVEKDGQVSWESVSPDDIKGKPHLPYRKGEAADLIEENVAISLMQAESIVSENMVKDVLIQEHKSEIARTEINQEISTEIARTEINQEISTEIARTEINQESSTEIARTEINQEISTEISAPIPIITNTVISQETHESIAEEIEEVDFEASAPAALTSHVVIRSFLIDRRDELKVSVGDLIGIERYFDDGWVRVQNITQNRKRGMIPLAILTPIKTGPTQSVTKDGNFWNVQTSEEEISIPAEIGTRISSLRYCGSLKSKISSDVFTSDDETTKSVTANYEESTISRTSKRSQSVSSKKRVVFNSEDTII